MVASRAKASCENPWAYIDASSSRRQRREIPPSGPEANPLST
jgi:hypothetical protein